MNNNKFTHIKNKKLSMVDTSEKKSTKREASALAIVKFKKEVYKAIKTNGSSKGEIFSTARIAAIQGAKKTYELIPLCHNIKIDFVSVMFTFIDTKHSVQINSIVKTNDNTGVEMEALSAVTIAALTVYDMCKSIDKGIEIGNIKLISKSGGKSGSYNNDSI